MSRAQVSGQNTTVRIHAYFGSRVLQSNPLWWTLFYPGAQGFHRSSRRNNESYNFHSNSLITNFFELFTGCLISMFCPSRFLCGPRLRARRVFIQHSGRLALALRYLHQGFISNLLLRIIVDFGIWKRKSCSESPLVHLVKVYRCSTLFPLLIERKFEPNSAVDELMHVNIKCCRYIRVCDSQVARNKRSYLRPHQFQTFYIRYTPSRSQLCKNLCFSNNLRYKWRKKRLHLDRTKIVCCGMSRHVINHNYVVRIFKTLRTLTNFKLSL